jgi:protein phosphatase
MTMIVPPKPTAGDKHPGDSALFRILEHLPRLRTRNVGGMRSLALREFALGIEALERFVRKEPLRRVHECVFGVLALESEPFDPRL